MTSERVNLLAGVNPVTRLFAMVVFATPLLLSVDWVSATVALVIVEVFAPLVGASDLLRRGWFLFVLAGLSGISMLLYGDPGGEVYFSWWAVNISENSVELAIAITLRVLAVALPMIVLARDMEATEIGDALCQVLRLPPRFVLGAVAAVRMFAMLQDDWETVAKARRARGLADEGRIKRLATMAFALLVLALRRGGKLATAMEARGFARVGTRQRTWARSSALVRKDYLVMVVVVGLAAVPVVVSVVTDSWRFFGL